MVGIASTGVVEEEDTSEAAALRVEGGGREAEVDFQVGEEEEKVSFQ